MISAESMNSLSERLAPLARALLIVALLPLRNNREAMPTAVTGMTPSATICCHIGNLSNLLLADLGPSVNTVGISPERTDHGRNFIFCCNSTTSIAVSPATCIGQNIGPSNQAPANVPSPLAYPIPSSKIGIPVCSKSPGSGRKSIAPA